MVTVAQGVETKPTQDVLIQDFTVRCPYGTFSKITVYSDGTKIWVKHDEQIDLYPEGKGVLKARRT